MTCQVTATKWILLLRRRCHIGVAFSSSSPFRFSRLRIASSVAVSSYIRYPIEYWQSTKHFSGKKPRHPGKRLPISFNRHRHRLLALLMQHAACSNQTILAFPHTRVSSTVDRRYCSPYKRDTNMIEYNHMVSDSARKEITSICHDCIETTFQSKSKSSTGQGRTQYLTEDSLVEIMSGSSGLHFGAES